MNDANGSRPIATRIRLLLGAAVCVGLGIAGTLSKTHGYSPTNALNASVVPSDVEVSTDGKLKLFDSASK